MDRLIKCIDMRLNLTYAEFACDYFVKHKHIIKISLYLFTLYFNITGSIGRSSTPGRVMNCYSSVSSSPVLGPFHALVQYLPRPL
jgi:hypothetical protein